MKVVGGPASGLLASRLAEHMNAELLQCEFKEFPDGEVYARVVDEITDEHVAVVQSTPTNTDIIYLLQLLDACQAAKKITAVIPYFGYARQDKQFQPGEALSSRAIARAIRADETYVINIHNDNVLGYFTPPAANLDAAPLIGEYIKTAGIDNPIIIGPDGGAEELAEKVAEKADAEYDVLEKTRISSEEVEIKPKKLSANNRNIVIVDDIISTGGTIAESAALLREQGANEVYVMCVHAVLAGNASEKLNAQVKEVISTDTIEQDISKISVAPLVADALG